MRDLQSMQWRRAKTHHTATSECGTLVHFLLIAGLTVAALHPSTGRAQGRTDTDTEPLSLAKMSEEVANRNPQIEQAQQAYVAAKAQVRIVTTLPNPTAFIYETPIANNPLRLGAVARTSISLRRCIGTTTAVRV